MNQTPRPLLSRAPRLSGWLLITLALLLAVWLIAPQQLPVSLYKLSLVSLAAVVGYWLDRSIFPYARPDGYLNLRGRVSSAVLRQTMGMAMLRRAIIIGSAMLAMGLGA
ncbi:MAG: putative holin [Rhodoferax sp.]|nr:putative holin [Rhodoferax sp.]